MNEGDNNGYSDIGWKSWRGNWVNDPVQWVMNEPLDPSLIFEKQDGLPHFNDMYRIISEPKIQT